MSTKYKQATLALGLGLPCLITGTIVSNRAEAATLFTANLTGSQEVPANTSTASGFGTILLNDAETQITVNLSFSGLAANATAAHIHSPAASGVNAPVLFPFSNVPTATSGIIPQQIFSITTAQVGFLKGGLLYFNIHNAAFPGGEIRGQIHSTPEPSSILGFLAFGTLGAASALKRNIKNCKFSGKK